MGGSSSTRKVVVEDDAGSGVVKVVCSVFSFSVYLFAHAKEPHSYVVVYCSSRTND